MDATDIQIIGLYADDYRDAAISGDPARAAAAAAAAELASLIGDRDANLTIRLIRNAIGR